MPKIRGDYMPVATKKDDRLEIRLEADRRELLDAAAEASGMSTSAFVLAHATQAAREVLSGPTTINLPADHWTAFLQLLERPVQPVEGLAAFLARRSVLEAEE